MSTGTLCKFLIILTIMDDPPPYKLYIYTLFSAADLARGARSSVGSTVQHHGALGRQRHDRADRQHRITTPGEEAQQDVAPELLPAGVRSAQQRRIPRGSEELCPELRRLLPRLLFVTAQGQVGNIIILIFFFYSDIPTVPLFMALYGINFY